MNLSEFDRNKWIKGTQHKRPPFLINYYPSLPAHMIHDVLYEFVKYF